MLDMRGIMRVLQTQQFGLTKARLGRSIPAPALRSVVSVASTTAPRKAGFCMSRNICLIRAISYVQSAAKSLMCRLFVCVAPSRCFVLCPVAQSHEQGRWTRDLMLRVPNAVRCLAQRRAALKTIEVNTAQLSAGSHHKDLLGRCALSVVYQTGYPIINTAAIDALVLRDAGRITITGKAVRL